MNTLQTPIQVLDKMVALNLNISLWSARKKMTFEDFDHIPNTDLPPQDLATLGTKKIAPPESLRIFTTLKARAVSLLDKYGIRFMSGWAIPEDLITEVMEEMTKIKEEFTREKENFLNEYDTLVNDWISKHSEWQEMLQNSTESPDYVRARMTFSWQVYRVQSSTSSNTSFDTGLEQAVESLGNTLFDEIAKTADETWRKVYEGKDSVTHKALSPLKTLEQKLRGLSFVEPHVLPVANMINTTLERIPKRGNITGGSLVSLQGLVCLMRDKNTLINHAHKLILGADIEEVVDGISPDILSHADEVQLAAYIEASKEMQDENSIPIIADSLGLW